MGGAVHVAQVKSFFSFFFCFSSANFCLSYRVLSFVSLDLELNKNKKVFLNSASMRACMHAHAACYGLSFCSSAVLQVG